MSGLEGTDLANVGAMRDGAGDWVEGISPDYHIEVGAFFAERVVAGGAEFSAGLPPAVLPHDNIFFEFVV